MSIATYIRRGLCCWLLCLACAAGAQISSGVVVIQAPSVAADSVVHTGSTDTLCPGESIVLSVAGGQLGTNASWTWYAGTCGTGQQLGSGAMLTVTPDTTLTYYCTATGGCNAVLCRAVTIYVSDVPGCTPLPLDLLDFEVRRYEADKALLLWTTVREVNLRHFIVERATDGVAFTALGSVAARGGNEPEGYRFIDSAPQAGSNYYRLRMVDADGTQLYSPVRLLWYYPEQNQVQLYPNPAGAELYFELEGAEEGLLHTWIYSAVSQRVSQRQEQRLVKGKNKVRTEIGSLADGAYFFFYRLNHGPQRSIKFVKKN